MFDIFLRLIVENSFEILNLSSMKHDFSPWIRSTLCHGQIIKWTKAKVHVYSDSVLCLGKLHNHSEANETWRDQFSDFQRSNEYAELYGIDGEPLEFEWNMFPGFTSIEIVRQIQKDLKTRQLKSRTICYSCRWPVTLIGQGMEIHWTVFRYPEK